MTEFLRPASIEEAVAAGTKSGGVYLAGGVSVNGGPRGTGEEDGASRVLVSLQDLGLEGVSVSSGSIAIGAMTSLQDILDNPQIPQVLKAAASMTGSKTLRNMITLGGEVGGQDPRSCVIPVLMALDARVICAGASGTREYGVAEYSSGEDRDLITGFSMAVPVVPCAVRSVSRTSHSSKSLVCAAAALFDRGVVSEARIVAADGVSPPTRLTDLEDGLTGKALPAIEEIEGMCRGVFGPAADIHASAAYKRYLAGIFVADTLYELAEVKP